MTGADTIAQACTRWGVSRSTLERLRRTEGFPFVRIGRHVVIPIEAAGDWFNQRIETGGGAA